MKKINVGAVMYSPQVKVVWDIIADYFREGGIEINNIFFSNYKDQVDYLVEGKIDIAWNSPLAQVMAEIKSNGECGYSYMRDTDRDRRTVFIVRKDSNFKSIADLKGKNIGFGAFDSPQSRLIPIEYLRKNGLEFGKDYIETQFNIGVGLHGDHEGGEKDALIALVNGEVDASLTMDKNWDSWVASGIIDPNVVEKLDLTDPYDHCIFTVRKGFDPELLKEWEELLSKMDYNNPEHKEMMDLEGLKKWVDGRLEGFEQVRRAIKYVGFEE
ncbi:phosphate/phosphite/phosphonate ABC transporter substrate-binding protein [Peptostreptococcus faecalis]|uniref:phosphate/phosphite/phosphonate ABC transporter substrate-binding protein n=1 Tax=Peptostreptococcus faecalis TaxID=2045015 RepID=UPI000C7AE16F|nr:PhnD/SsuA/transferrin family substrate-binding protein [Peptostreptococcus faecalis]